MASLGAGMDVVSEGEYRRARAAGVPGERIVFSGVGKTRAEMALALRHGIRQFNVESEPELDRALRGRDRARPHRPDRAPRQPRRRRPHPRQDRHRQGREQVRHPDRPRPRRLRRGGATARHRGRRRRRPHRQPADRPRPLRGGLRQGRRADRGAARRRPRHPPPRPRRRPRHPLPPLERGAAAAVRLRRGDPPHRRPPRLRDRDRARAADRRQRRRAALPRHLPQARARAATS